MTGLLRHGRLTTLARLQWNNMKKLILLFSILVAASASRAQLPFKFDDEYRKIYAADLCRLAKEHPDLVIIDVRTPGEFSDTSQYNSLNIGHLRGAINIEIDTMKKDSMLMEKYRDKTIVLYCSHSQRSRRVSKLLAERGFTNFYNLNGGMSSLNQLTGPAFPCKREWILSNLPYKNLNFSESSQLIKTQKGLTVLDVRPASEFNSIDTSIEKNIGRIKGSINIPYSEFRERKKDWPKEKDNAVLLYSGSGDGDGARAALLLAADGYTKVYQLLGGLDDFEATVGNALIENPLPYRFINSRGALLLMKSGQTLTIFDTRPASEYENKVTGMESYKNLGKIKKSIHVPESDFSTVNLPTNKQTVILIFGHAEAFRFANMLAAKGFKNVNLHSGIYDFVWSAFNVADCREDLEFMENHAGLY
jgi:rhodanese-related sulfurtransferase